MSRETKLRLLKAIQENTAGYRIMRSPPPEEKLEEPESKATERGDREDHLPFLIPSWKELSISAREASLAHQSLQHNIKQFDLYLTALQQAVKYRRDYEQTEPVFRKAEQLLLLDKGALQTPSEIARAVASYFNSLAMMVELTLKARALAQFPVTLPNYVFEPETIFSRILPHGPFQQENLSRMMFKTGFCSMQQAVTVVHQWYSYAAANGIPHIALGVRFALGLDHEAPPEIRVAKVFSAFLERVGQQNYVVETEKNGLTNTQLLQFLQREKPALQKHRQQAYMWSTHWIKIPFFGRGEKATMQDVPGYTIDALSYQLQKQKRALQELNQLKAAEKQQKEAPRPRAKSVLAGSMHEPTLSQRLARQTLRWMKGIVVDQKPRQFAADGGFSSPLEQAGLHFGEFNGAASLKKSPKTILGAHGQPPSILQSPRYCADELEQELADEEAKRSAAVQRQAGMGEDENQSISNAEEQGNAEDDFDAVDFNGYSEYNIESLPSGHLTNPVQKQDDFDESSGPLNEQQAPEQNPEQIAHEDNNAIPPNVELISNASNQQQEAQPSSTSAETHRTVSSAQQSGLAENIIENPLFDFDLGAVGSLDKLADAPAAEDLTL